MTTLGWILLGAFLFATDYTVQNNHIPKVDWKPKPRMERNVIYYNKIDSIGLDGIKIFEKDSIVYYDRVRNR